MDKQDFHPPCPTAEELRQALGLEKQHINVIAGKLHKLWPEHWPKPPVDPPEFYDKLLETIADKEHFLCVHQVLEEIAEEKGGKWRHIPIGKRVLAQATDLFKRLDPDAFRGATQEGMDMEGPEVVAWMSEHLKFPECAVHRKVFRWLVDIESEIETDRVQETDGDAGSDAEETDIPADATQQDPGPHWDQVLGDLRTVLDGGESNRFSRELIHEISSAVEKLALLADAHDEACAVEASALSARLLSTLDTLKPLLTDDETTLGSLLDQLRAHSDDAELLGRLRARIDVLDEIDAYFNAMGVASQHCKELTQLITKANDEGDDDAISGYVEERRAEKTRLVEQRDKLVGALNGLLRGTGIPAEPEITPSLDPASKASSRPNDDIATQEPDRSTGSDAGGIPVASKETQTEQAALGIPIAPEPDIPRSEVERTDAAVPEQRPRGPASEENPEEADEVPESSAPGLDKYPFDVDVAGLAAGIAEQETPPDAAVNALIWALIREDRVDLAYHLARAMSERGKLDLAAHSASCLLALFLARQVLGPTDEVAEPLRGALGDLLLIDFSSRSVRHRHANAFFAFAAALRPALLAPNITGARAVLEEGHLRLDSDSLHELRIAVLDSGRLGSTLTAASLKGQTGPGVWERSLAELRQGCRTWWNDYRNRRIRYAPTTHVWQNWLEDEGPIGTLLGAVAEDRRDLIDQARKQIDEWRDNTTVNRRLDQTDIEIRGRNAALRPIDGSPRNDVVRLAAEAMRFVQEWLDLHEARPAAERGAGAPEISDWARRTGSLLAKARDNLESYLADYQDLEDHAAARALLVSLDDLRDLLDPAVPIGRRRPWWKRLSEPLLLDPGIRLDAQWRPIRAYGDDALFRQLLALADVEGTWEAAFSAAEQDCAHGATERILEMLDWRQTPTDELDTLRRRREESLDVCRQQLSKRVSQVESVVAHAVDYGYLDEDERSRIIEELEGCKERKSGNIGAALRGLERIEADLCGHKQRRIEEERERLRQNQVLRDKPEQLERIERLLEQGAIATAAEYVTHAESGREPPSDAQADPFGDRFFPYFVTAVTERLGGQRSGEVLRALEGKDSLEPLTGPRIEASGGLELLCAWVALQGRRGETAKLVRELFSALGFVVVDLSIDDAGQPGETLLSLRTKPLQDRSVCIVPQYGSLARGSYRVSCIWERMPAEELRKHLGRRDGTPTFLLYLNRMSENQRRELAFQCRQNRQTFLVIDEWLLYFLLDQERATRPALLFQCGFPFSVVNPYTPTSSDVPDELFFGRRRAMEQIADLHGSNLVFGGRQLGKTALLREVKRRYHAPDRGVYVAWIDLKAAGIGLGRPPGEVWGLIARELAGSDYGLLSRQVSRPETVQKEIADWLEASSDRRLLILLDEADELFAQDAEAHYETLMGLKNLMERTNRRFKVVFAGLHNVQRMSRDVNSPVKHLSQPVCVGPLLDDGEAKEAFRLVSLPLRALGYRLADDVVNTILSYTNYYPNLIQHFCHSLLEFLNDPDQVRFDAENTPPYEITPEHVEQAYRRRELRQFIRDRFQITLDLDPRYRVIALRIAVETLDRRKNDEETTGGLSVEWIRDQALGLWSIGFMDRTTEAFRTLLDEMIGLGILRHAQRGYALRSPTVVNLLGTHEAIQQDLLDACLKDPPPIYRAATYRRSLSGDQGRNDQWQRSPLVAEQEYEILATDTGITLLFGAALSGVERVVQAVEIAAAGIPEADVQLLGDARDHNDFDKRMRAMLDRQRPDTNLVLVADQDCAWSEAWVQCAAKALSHKRSKKTTARVVFIGDATTGWIWSGLSDEQRDALGPLNVMTLKPWSEETLHQWQRDTAIGPISDEDLRKIKNATGLWDRPMFELGERIRANPGGWREAIDEARIRGPEARDTLIGDMNTIGDAVTPMRVFAEIDEALTGDDLLELAELPSRAMADRVLRWADLLAFALPDGDGKWRLDPFLARLIVDAGA